MLDRKPKLIPSLKQSDIDRFWSKVNKNGPIPWDNPTIGQCWTWTPKALSHGYGRMQIWPGRQFFLAHRIAFFIQNGYDPHPLQVLHICNNKMCIRHLKAGTPIENIRDAIKDGIFRKNSKPRVVREVLYNFVPSVTPIPPLTPEWIATFQTKIDRNPGHGDNKDCHIWTGWKNKGQGMTSVGNTKLAAHRIAYFIEFGVDPGSQMVIHTCGLRSCCRRDHMILGTFRDNMMNKYRLNRQVKGDTHGRRKITKIIALDMQQRYANGESQRSIAVHYGVSVMTVNLAVRGKTFKD